MSSSALNSHPKKSILLDQHNVLQSHWSSAGLNHGESDHTCK